MEKKLFPDFYEPGDFLSLLMLRIVPQVMFPVSKNLRDVLHKRRN
jgi:hypothetical protein